MDAWEVGKLLFKRTVGSRESPKRHFFGNIWNKAWGSGLAA
jgi:hypothetical protein